MSRKYWKMQKSIASRRRRTELFQSSIFKKRRSDDRRSNFGYMKGSFCHKVLYEVKQRIINNLGCRFENREWEETLLYAMASNSDLFGTVMMRYH
jgi:hypothetical protein